MVGANDERKEMTDNGNPIREHANLMQMFAIGSFGPKKSSTKKAGPTKEQDYEERYARACGIEEQEMVQCKHGYERRKRCESTLTGQGKDAAVKRNKANEYHQISLCENRVVHSEVALVAAWCYVICWLRIA